jgi:ubiquitin thioesterase protein OTUB1
MRIITHEKLTQTTVRIANLKLSTMLMLCAFLKRLFIGKMRSEEERFTPFIADSSFSNMEAYCKREVEPMGKECEQVQVIALTEYMGVGAQIDYLDGR